MGEGYELERRPPTPTEHRRLCEAVGWGEVINFEAAPTSLAASLFGVTVLHGGEAVAMGRVVGDGAIYFYLQDIAVHPGHQRRGLGARVVEALLDDLAARAPAKAFVGLFAARGTHTFYRRYGFEAHQALAGMFVLTPLPPRRGNS